MKRILLVCLLTTFTISHYSYAENNPDVRPYLDKVHNTLNELFKASEINDNISKHSLAPDEVGVTKPTAEEISKDQNAQSDISVTLNRETAAAYEQVVQPCYDVVTSDQRKINKAQKYENGSIVTGLLFNTVGIISTVHPVSAAFTAVGTMLFAGSKSVSNVISGEVDRQTTGYNNFQQAAKDAITTYWNEYKSSMTATGGPTGYLGAAQRLSALEELSSTCHQLGIGISPSPNNPNKPSGS